MYVFIKSPLISGRLVKRRPWGGAPSLNPKPTRTQAINIFMEQLWVTSLTLQDINNNEKDHLPNGVTQLVCFTHFPSPFGLWWTTSRSNCDFLRLLNHNKWCQKRNADVRITLASNYPHTLPAPGASVLCLPKSYYNHFGPLALCPVIKADFLLRIKTNSDVSFSRVHG